MGSWLGLLPCQGLGDHRTGHRFNRNRGERFGEGLLDVAAHAGDGAAGAYSRHQHIHLASGVLPDFRASGVVVDLGIGGVGELLEQHIAIGVAAGHGLCGGDGSRHTQLAVGKHQASAIGREQLAPLQAHGFRHGERERDALGRCHKCQGDASVATGGFDQFLAPSQQSIAFGLSHHRRADSALNRIGRVAAFNFGQHACAAAGCHSVQLHQGRAANAEAVVGVDRAH